MATQPTNKPIGSEDPRDLKFNAGKVDEWATSTEKEYTDRKGVKRLTAEGIQKNFNSAQSEREARFNNFLLNSGYQFLGDYELGPWQFSERNQYIRYDNQYWRLAAIAPQDFATTGITMATFEVDKINFVLMDEGILRSDLASGNGDLVGTDHRGDLRKDLNALDRRPDGYNNVIEDVLSTGFDVQINDDISISHPVVLEDNQIIQGVGGKITVITKLNAIGASGKSGLRLFNVHLIGSIENGPVLDNAAYGVNFSNCEDIVIDGLNTSGFTGSLVLSSCIDSIIRNIFSRDNRYHSDVKAGGYGVLLQGCKGITVDGINFLADAAKGDLGRHPWYVSRISTDPDSKCVNVTIQNVRSVKKNLNNREMWDGVIRMSDGTTVQDFDMRGSNGSISLFTENGAINDTTIKDGTIEVFSYNNTLSIYGIDNNIQSGANGATDIQRLRIHDVKIILTNGDGFSNGFMIGVNLCCENSSVVDTEFYADGNATPIQISGGKNLLVKDIIDTVRTGEITNPLIQVTGTVDGLRVLSVSTSRAIISGLDYVTNMIVNYQRKARVINTTGNFTTEDTNRLILSVVAASPNIEVTFRPHVSQNAINNAVVEMLTAGVLMLVTNRSDKKMIFRLTDLDGNLRPISSSSSFTITLSS